jgi:putative drug exporter of the RND superfamily
MNPLGQSQNIAARMGRWSARHWKTATLGWLALIALVFVLGSRVGTKELSDARGMNGDSARAQHIIDSAGFPDNPAEVVLVQSTTLTVRDAAFRRAVEDVVRALSQVKGVEHVRSPYTRGNEDQLSKSGRSALVPFEPEDNTDEAYDGVAGRSRPSPPFSARTRSSGSRRRAARASTVHSTTPSRRTSDERSSLPFR